MAGGCRARGAPRGARRPRPESGEAPREAPDPEGGAWGERGAGGGGGGGGGGGRATERRGAPRCAVAAPAASRAAAAAKCVFTRWQDRRDVIGEIREVTVGERCGQRGGRRGAGARPSACGTSLYETHTHSFVPERLPS